MDNNMSVGTDFNASATPGNEKSKVLNKKELKRVILTVYPGH
jgi:hypothetical protein